LRERDENRVFVITADNLVEKRDVTLGFSDEDRVEIVEGIQAGEAVVTVGYEVLADGYAVNVLSWEDPAAPEQTSPSPAREQLASLPASAPDSQQILDASNREMGRGPERGRGPGGREGRREMSPEIVERMMGRLLNDPQIKQEYETRLADDPELATDFEKKRTFAQEMMLRFRSRDADRRP
jgi:hypothetical protein